MHPTAPPQCRGFNLSCQPASLEDWPPASRDAFPWGLLCPLSLFLWQQRAEAESVNRQLRKQLSDYGVPSVLSYVRKKMAVTDLENSLKAWERKVAIVEVSETRLGVQEPSGR